MLTKLFLDRLSASYNERLIQIERSKCLRSRLSSSSCSLCFDACPEGAVVLLHKIPGIETDVCTDCMVCVAVCPVDVFTCEAEIDELVNRAHQTDHLRVACPRNQQAGEADYSIPCVGVLSDEILLAVSLLTNCTVTFEVSKCSQCQNFSVFQRFEDKVRSLAEAFSSKISEQFKIHASPAVSKELQTSMERRGYINQMVKSAVRFTKYGISNGQKEEPCPGEGRRLAPKKNYLLRQLLQHVEPTLRRRLEEEYCYRLKVHDHCTFCPLCKGICPTGAIQIEKRGEQKQLVFHYQQCIGCGLCVCFCKQNALILLVGYR